MFPEEKNKIALKIWKIIIFVSDVYDDHAVRNFILQYLDYFPKHLLHSEAALSISRSKEIL